MVFYFTGTGNSLYVAKQLEENPISIPLAKQLCEKCGVTVNYINLLLMVNNLLPGFDMNEQKSIDKKIEEHIASIRSDIDHHRHMIAEVTDEDRAAR